MKQLILAEKPSVARDLAKVLGATQKTKNYIEGPGVVITWALGHLLTLKMPEDFNPAWAQWQMETLPMIPQEFGIKPLPKTRGQLNAIRKLAQRKDISEAVIATDAGREGELVARWILEYVNFKKPVKRLWISSQTPKAIQTGFENLQPAKKYDTLYQSALARSQADWLVGLNVSRALTVKYDDSLAAGRVQTPTLAMVREQEIKIEKFKPTTYFNVSLVYEGLKGLLDLKHPRSLKNQQQGEEKLRTLKQEKALVKTIQERRRSQSAPLPYDLTEIQREANQRFGFSARKTLNTVQSLYEHHKVVTYPRTDSKYLTSDMKNTMKERLNALVAYYPKEAKKILQSGAKITNQRVFQDEKVTDHHGLLPTEIPATIHQLSRDEQRIYEMISQRFLGLFAANYQWTEQTVLVTAGSEQLTFKQRVLTEPGWRGLEQEPAEKPLVFKEGQQLAPTYELSQERTSPPAALSEGTLLGQMEKHNLGTPATRAEIIEKLISSQLMTREGQRLVVTPKGKQLLDLVNPSLVTPKLTEKWERELEAIALGEQEPAAFIAEIEAKTKDLVAEIKRSQKTYQDFSLSTKKCPECGEFLRVRQTRDGRIYVCSRQECKYRRRKDPKVSNRRCPQCHRRMEIHQGDKGSYFRCKNCALTEKMDTKKQRRQRISKREEKQLLKKYSQTPEPVESEMARALREAMEGQ